MKINLSVVNNSVEEAKRRLDNADYLNAAAIFIGAFISLVPIFWLVQQNKQMKIQADEQNRLIRDQMKVDKDGFEKQLALQQAQNNAIMFNLAREMLNENKKDQEIYVGLQLFEELICVEEGKYVPLIVIYIFRVVFWHKAPNGPLRFVPEVSNIVSGGIRFLCDVIRDYISFTTKGGTYNTERLSLELKRIEKVINQKMESILQSAARQEFLIFSRKNSLN